MSSAASCAGSGGVATTLACTTTGIALARWAKRSVPAQGEKGGRHGYRASPAPRDTLPSGYTALPSRDKPGQGACLCTRPRSAARPGASPRRRPHSCPRAKAAAASSASRCGRVRVPRPPRYWLGPGLGLGLGLRLGLGSGLALALESRSGWIRRSVRISIE